MIGWLLPDGFRELAGRRHAERQMFIQQFWQRRDPSPAGSADNDFRREYTRRLAYVDAHYSTAGQGRDSDRGRVYLKYGPADEIESHPSGDRNPRNFPWEQWLYRHIEGVGDNVIFEFVDRSGNGDYRMTQATVVLAMHDGEV